MQNLRQLSLCFLWAMFFCCSITAETVQAKTNVQCSKFVQIPVFYVTDREKCSNTFSAPQKIHSPLQA